MTEPKWLSPSFIISLHEILISQHGGSSGVRDEGLLDSALTKPVQTHHYKPMPIPELAAAYAVGIIQNHPFVDGNKRTGFVAAATFMEINGFELTASEVDATLATLALAAGEMTQEEYAAWLVKNSQAQ